MAKHKKSKKCKRSKHSSSSSLEDWVEIGSKQINFVDKRNEMCKGPEIEDEVQWENIFNKKYEYKSKCKKLDVSSSKYSDIKELNPYWKNGGCGLPDSNKKKECSSKIMCDNLNQEPSNCLVSKDISPEINNSIYLNSNMQESFRSNFSVQNWRKTSNDSSLKLDEGAPVNIVESKPIIDKNDLNAKILKAKLKGDEKLAEDLKLKLLNISMQSENVCKSNIPGKTSKLVKLVKAKKMMKYEDMSLPMMFINEKSTFSDYKLKPNEVNQFCNEYTAEDDKLYRLNENYTIKKSFYNSVALRGCCYCYDSEKISKHLIVAIGKHVYLALPKHQSLTDGHCLIIPLVHTSCSLYLETDAWFEVKQFISSLNKMFNYQNQECIVMETAMNIRNYPHMIIECIPVCKTLMSTLPIYFKKAIMDCETEWSLNQKLIQLSNISDVRKKLPKGLSYFFVIFGDQSELQKGYAHVIEDEKYFPVYFGKEILGEVLCLNYSLWKNPLLEEINIQCEKVYKFCSAYKEFDWTEKPNNLI